MSVHYLLKKFYVGSIHSQLRAKVRDQVSHPCSSTGKNYASVFLIFTFLDMRWDDKIFWTE